MTDGPNITHKIKRRWAQMTAIRLQCLTVPRHPGLAEPIIGMRRRELLQPLGLDHLADTRGPLG